MYLKLVMWAILLVTYFGCEKDIQDTESEYSIEYDPIHLDKITPNSWLEIDGVKICHEYKLQLNKECCNFTVPFFKFIELEIEGKQQISYMNKIDFSMQLYEKKFKNSKYYVVTNPNLIFNVGIINFKRQESYQHKIQSRLSINNQVDEKTTKNHPRVVFLFITTKEYLNQWFLVLKIRF